MMNQTLTELPTMRRKLQTHRRFESDMRLTSFQERFKQTYLKPRSKVKLNTRLAPLSPKETNLLVSPESTNPAALADLRRSF